VVSAMGYSKNTFCIPKRISAPLLDHTAVHIEARVVIE
jgi:hypothetical protein